ncbi:hypothetical protein AALO_G00206930 [Alosa alosa]|uniref:Nuclear mitotic apparatus protein 1 N-terminal hook domain-containing protein n=1 Tax=Alosa alosa TaxID=278164 RepID=A0AAV6G6Y1_9TELE|nr:hypothetical protein AALO_G00206930 [Alosa alosa]
MACVLAERKEKALLAWVNNFALGDSVGKICELRDGYLLSQLPARLGGREAVSSVDQTPAERFKEVADFLDKQCRFTAGCGVSISWEKITDALSSHADMELAKVVLLLCHHSMAVSLFPMHSLDYNTELELVSMFRYIVEDCSGYYLTENLEQFLTRKTVLDVSSSSSVSSSDGASPALPLRRKTSVRFLELNTVASNAVSSPIQELMSTPQFQLCRLRRQVAQEEQVRDELEKELSEHRSSIQEKDSQVAQLQHRLQKVQREQLDQEAQHKNTLQELQNKNDGLLQRLHEVLRQSQDLKTDNLQKEKRVDHLCDENGLLSTQVRELAGQLASLRQQMMLLQEEELQSGSRKQELQKELSQALQHKECLSEQLEIERGKVCVLEEELTEVRFRPCHHGDGEVMGPIMEWERLQQEVTKLQTEVAQKVVLQQEVMKREEEVTRLLLQLQEAAREKQADLVSLETECAQRVALQQELSVLQVRLHEWEESKKRAEIKVQALRRELETVQTLNSTLQRENSATQRLADTLQKQLEMKEYDSKKAVEKRKHAGEKRRVEHDLSSDSLSLDDSLNSTSTPVARSSRRLAMKQGSVETLYFTPMGTQPTTRLPGDRITDSAHKLTSSAQRRRTTQTINITMKRNEKPSLQAAQSHPNLSSCPVATELPTQPGNPATTATAAASDNLLNLPGYRRSSIFNAAPARASSAFCVGMENEPDQAGEDWLRIAELQRRNKNCPQHLKSSYTLETMQVLGAPCEEDEMRFGDPSETLRRASTLPGQLQASLASHRLSTVPAKRPATNQGPATPEVKRQATCFSRPLTPKNRNTTHLANQNSPLKSPAERRQSMMFCIGNTPQKNGLILRSLRKLRNSARKSPASRSAAAGPAPRRSPRNRNSSKKVSLAPPSGSRRRDQPPQLTSFSPSKHVPK